MVLEEARRDLSETELIAACRRGESEAFRDLFERYKDRVYSVALRYSGDATLAEDIAQDTFVKLFNAIATFRGDSGFESWLYRLIVNSCFDHKRKSRRFLPLLSEMFELMRAPGASALDAAMEAQIGSHLHALVNALPSDQRMVVVLRYTEGLSYEEIAAAMGCSTGTVASRLNRAHKVLGRRMAQLAVKEGKRG
jgi:RNA polymerase sigma-70 factor (ECF subfamily)